MKHSTKRMLTTHTGSLARPLELIEAMQVKERGEAYDAEAYSGLVRDAVADVVDRRVNAGAYSFKATNPAHEHEWKVWETAGLPDGKVLIPGVISHSTNVVEHPELVAQRLVRYANIVGRENVIGGSDCGFSSFASTEPEIHPTVVWAKFENMAEGARLASRELWG